MLLYCALLKTTTKTPDNNKMRFKRSIDFDCLYDMDNSYMFLGRTSGNITQKQCFIGADPGGGGPGGDPKLHKEGKNVAPHFST